MHVPKIHKIFYWIIIVSMLLSVSFPSGLIAAQTVGKVQKSPATFTEIQQIPTLSELKNKQIETPLPFNFPDEKLEKNKIEGGLTFETEIKQTAISQEITSGRLPTKPFELKFEQNKIEEPEVISGTSLTTDRTYFDSLVKKLNPPKPKSLSEAKSLGWPEINFEKPQSIKDLVKQVPKELADKIGFPEEEIIKGETRKESRTTPLLGLQPEYLIFFAKQDEANPINQTLKINNRGEGTRADAQSCC